MEQVETIGPTWAATARAPVTDADVDAIGAVIGPAVPPPPDRGSGDLWDELEIWRGIAKAALRLIHEQHRTIARLAAARHVRGDRA